MGSYESEVKEEMSKGNRVDGKLDITLIKFVCQTSPLTLNKTDNLPHFFKKVALLNSFSDREVWQLSKFLHRREFRMDEVVFRQGDSGYGFYFIFSGAVNVMADLGAKVDNPNGELVVQLKQHQYFGEMGLLEDFNRRSATVIASEKTVLLGLFKPDLEDLIETYPIVGAKFLREISLVMATRMSQLSEELMTLKKKVNEYEGKANS